MAVSQAISGSYGPWPRWAESGPDSAEGRRLGREAEPDAQGTPGSEADVETHTEGGVEPGPDQARVGPGEVGAQVDLEVVPFVEVLGDAQTPAGRGREGVQAPAGGERAVRPRFDELERDGRLGPASGEENALLALEAEDRAGPFDEVGDEGG